MNEAKRLDWQLGYGRDEQGTIVRVRDEQECYFARTADMAGAIRDYIETAQYTGTDEVRCVADLVVDGVATDSRAFDVPATAPTE